MKFLMIFALFCFNLYSADHNLNESVPYKVIDVGTSSTVTITIPDRLITIVHLGKKSDGSDSGASDYVVIMNSVDQNRTSVTMAANLNAGNKAILFKQSTISFSGSFVPEVDQIEGRRIQIQAVTGSAKLLIMKDFTKESK